MLEHIFVELGYATLTAKDSLEETAEEFAMVARMEAGTRDFPVFLKVVSNIETPWHRYLGYAVLFVFFIAYTFTCASLPQYEEMISEARRQRYVRT